MVRPDGDHQKTPPASCTSTSSSEMCFVRGSFVYIHTHAAHQAIARIVVVSRDARSGRCCRLKRIADLQGVEECAEVIRTAGDWRQLCVLSRYSLDKWKRLMLTASPSHLLLSAHFCVSFFYHLLRCLLCFSYMFCGFADIWRSDHHFACDKYSTSLLLRI